MSGSLAIMGDAAHMISDLASLLVSLLAIWIGNRQPKKSFNFGYARAEVLGALITIGESYESFDRKRALVKYQPQSKVIKVIL